MTNPKVKEMENKVIKKMTNCLCMRKKGGLTIF